MTRSLFAYAVNSKAILAAGSFAEGALGYATDTNEFGFYNGSAWVWSAGDLSITDTSSVDLTLTGHVLSATVLPAGVDHNQLLNYASNRHFLQTDIANVSTALSTGLLTVVNGTGALGSTANNSANWDTAYGWGNHASAGYATGTGAANRLTYWSGAGTVTSSANLTVDVATSKIILGADVNIYRNAANILKTDDSFHAPTLSLNAGTLPAGVTMGINSGVISDANLPVQINAGAGLNISYMGINKPGSTYGLLLGYENGTGGFAKAGGYVRTVPNEPIYFVVNNGTFAQTILGNGNVGIGNTLPGARFDVTSPTVYTGAAHIGVRISTPLNGVGNYALQLSGTEGTAASGITFGTDVTLYRGAANELWTDDHFKIRAATTPEITLLTLNNDIRAGNITGKINFYKTDETTGGAGNIPYIQAVCTNFGGDFTLEMYTGTVATPAKNIVMGSTGTVFNDDGTAALNLRAESDTEPSMIELVASTDKLYLGGTTNGIEISKGGELVLLGTATYWVDLNFPLVAKTTGAGLPSYQTLTGNLTMLQWAVNDALQCDSEEFIHQWKEASAATWHVHIITNGLDATNRYIRFEVEYTWANFGAALPATVTITSADMLIPANTADRTHFIFDIGSFTATGGKIGAHVKARVKRVAAVGTAPSGNVFAEKVQLHLECDTLGSRAITTK